MKQIVSITFFRFEGFKNRWWAFTQMGRKAFLNTEKINTPKEGVTASGTRQSGERLTLKSEYGTFEY